MGNLRVRVEFFSSRDDGKAVKREGQIIFISQQIRHRLQHFYSLWNAARIRPFSKVPSYEGSFTFLAIQILDPVGSPPAHRYQNLPKIYLLNGEPLFIAFNIWLSTSRSSSSGSSSRYFSNVLDAASISPSL